MQKLIYKNKSKIFYEVGDEVYSVHDGVTHIIDKIDLPNMKLICTDGTFLPISTETKATAETLDNAIVINKKFIKGLNIKIKYIDDTIERLHQIDIGNWIDLRSAYDIELKKGEYKLIHLGVAMELPNGFEAYIVPRSSTYKNFKVIQTNHHAVIDNSYCGNNDWWFMPVYALEDTIIHKNDRICQFRIDRAMPKINFCEVKELGNADRGGLGSTGTK